jgi:hypothetical protein
MCQQKSKESKGSTKSKSNGTLKSNTSTEGPARNTWKHRPSIDRASDGQEDHKSHPSAGQGQGMQVSEDLSRNMIRKGNCWSGTDLNVPGWAISDIELSRCKAK